MVEPHVWILGPFNSVSSSSNLNSGEKARYTQKVTRTLHLPKPNIQKKDNFVEIQLSTGWWHACQRGRRPRGKPLRQPLSSPKQILIPNFTLINMAKPE